MPFTTNIKQQLQEIGKLIGQPVEGWSDGAPLAFFKACEDLLQVTQLMHETFLAAQQKPAHNL